MDRPSRTRLVTAAVLAVIFGAGVVLGMALDRTVEAAPAPAQEVVEPVAEQQEEEPERRRVPLYEQVEPTPEQLALIEEIVRGHRSRMSALRKEFRTTYEERETALIDSARVAIKGVLSAEQAARYDRLTADYDRRRAERERDGGR